MTKSLINDERVDVNGWIPKSAAITPLCYLVNFLPDHPNLLELVQLLIQKGADVNKNSLAHHEGRSWTPLTCLCGNSRLSDQLKIKLAQLLLESGADVNSTKDAWGRTPLHNFFVYCRNDNLVDIIKLLIQNGADVRAKDAFGDTPLHKLMRRNDEKGILVDLAKLLLDNGADVNAKNNDMWTPLLTLCKFQPENEKLIDVIRLLIQKGAEVDARRLDGKTPLRLLCENYKKDDYLTKMLDLLIENGAEDIYAECYAGMIPLKTCLLRKV